MRGSIVRLLVAGLLTIGVVVGATAPAMAQTEGMRGDLLITEGPLRVGPQDQIGLLVVTSGDVTIAGRVNNVVVFSGDLTVTGSGSVTDNAYAVTGDVTVMSGGTIGADAYAGGEFDVAAGSVAGTATHLSVAQLTIGAQLIGLLWWIGFAIGLFVLGLLVAWLAPTGLRATREVARHEVGLSVSVGLALAIGLPILGVVAAITLIGLPVAVGLLLATLVVASVGYVVAAFVVGGAILQGASRPIPDLVLGLVVLGLLGWVPFVGGLVGGMAAAYGVGAITVTTWRARGKPSYLMSGTALEPPLPFLPPRAT